MKRTTILAFQCLVTFANGLTQTNTPLPKNPTEKAVSFIPASKPPQQPALTQCLNIVQDPAGKALQKAFVWADLPVGKPGVAVGFRRTFDLESKPTSGFLQLFADARYILWVNGSYVDRGPARFQPNGPEYDMIEISRFLKRGKNAVALLVAGNLSGGKVMRHRPGLTASLEVNGKMLWKTDDAWRWSDSTRFRSVSANWPNLWESEVDARVEDGDWTTADYNDGSWKHASPIQGTDWGPLTARRIPLLGEKEVSFAIGDGKVLPVTLKAGEKLVCSTGRIVQAYPVIEFNAEAGTEISIQPYRVHYVAKGGPQRHFTLDTRGITEMSVSVTKGEATITGLKLVERLYPYERLARFDSDDSFLNRLWEMCARSCEVLSEDSYVDCADRERVEWMDDTPPAYDVTRIAMAGPAEPGGGQLHADPRLLGELIRRTALTLQPEGWVKAHTCSDRYDIHAKMEDRACDWVEGIRLYHDATGNASAVREIWPAVKAQMEYFLKRRTGKGLVSARDWVVWKNPTAYLEGQTTPLNSFVFRSLADASHLAGIVGDAPAKERYAKASEDLKKAINAVLWDEKGGCYYGGYFSPEEIEANASVKTPFRSREAPLAGRLKEGYFPSTLEANLFALDRGVVPGDRRQRVVDAVVAEVRKGNVGGGIMTAYYLFKQLYSLDTPEFDSLILAKFREKFRAMVDSPLQCSWEGYGGGSLAHIYGMYPGYFLSAYVLGVRRDAPVAEGKLLIEPHLGDLRHVSGTVETEFGPVTVAWTRDCKKIEGQIGIPKGPATTLALPLKEGVTSVLIDGRETTGAAIGSRLLVPLAAGTHTITY